MSTYVLVHGAWHGAWCWKKPVPLLETRGHRVVTPDLPALGNDQTPISEVTFQSYVDRVCRCIDAEDEPVILVGHSMSGMVVSQVAEQRPDKIATLVYLSSFLPRNGESLIHLAGKMEGSLVHPNMIFSDDGSYVSLDDEVARQAFYGDCSPGDAKWAVALLRPQATAPLATPVKLTAGNYGRIKRVYITCLQDRAIPPASQKKMYLASPCETVFSLEAGHSPFLSVPEKLAQLLLSLCDGFYKQERIIK